MPHAARLPSALTIFAAGTCVLGLALLAWAWREPCATYALVLVGFPGWVLGSIAALVVISARGPTRRRNGGGLLFANAACFALSWMLPSGHCS